MSSRGAQASFLVALAAAWGLGANALRDEPLPLRGSLEPPPPPEAGADLPAMSAEDAARAWTGGAFFVDVRDPNDFEMERVAGAVSLPAADFDARYFDLVASLDPAVPLVVYGAGPDSFAVRRVAQELRDRGHLDVELVVGGPAELFATGVSAAEGPEGMP